MLIIAGHFILLLVVVASALQKNHEGITNSCISGCIPCSQKFIAESYFEKHDNLVDSDFEAFLAKEFPSTASCQMSQHDMSDMVGPSISRYLIGEGSHRRLVTSVRLDFGARMSMFDAEFCKAVVIERLPAGVFADPFELQHLVEHNVFFNAAVFGDTNLELPSSLSNRSVVEIHKNTWKYASSKQLNAFQFTFEIPLHARYQPLDSKGYSTVVMGQPDVMLRCAPREYKHHDCSSLLIWWSVRHTSDIAWQMPCGSKELTRLVDVITFASALLSALLIVVFSVSFFSS